MEVLEVGGGVLEGGLEGRRGGERVREEGGGKEGKGGRSARLEKGRRAGEMGRSCKREESGAGKDDLVCSSI